jgi:hypothetical protein
MTIGGYVGRKLDHGNVADIDDGDVCIRAEMAAMEMLMALGMLAMEMLKSGSVLVSALELRCR